MASTGRRRGSAVPATGNLVGAPFRGKVAGGAPTGSAPSSTTVKLNSVTRERLRDHDGTADQVINEALDALDREAYRRQAEADALRLAADAGDVAELAEIRALLNTPLDRLE